ncbi:MAG: nicotinate-nucleotide adenylyltransferase [Lachnospiraceae bacterium]
MVKIGLIHGRFQVLHLKHMEYILAAKMRCNTLYIGITNPDDRDVRETDNDLQRSTPCANPLTYFERYEMIHDALLDFGVPRDAFEIVPFPINCPEYILQYAPKDAIYYMSICDAWDEEKLKMLHGLGVKTEILWRKTPEEKGTTGAEIRQCIVEGTEWSHLVPKTVYEYMKKHHLDERVIEQHHLEE